MAALGAAVLLTTFAATQAPPVVAGGSCTGWKSLTVPPKTIRVKVDRNKVRKVDFKRYVAVVMGHEWGGYLPQAVLDAAAIAVKQYAWYHALAGHHRRSFVTASGQCYDVVDSTRDQMFKPETARVVDKHWLAIERTWNISLRKSGRFVMTGYRTGERGVNCGRDANGWHLKARSAIDCARRGLSGLQIIRRYYSPRLEIVNARSSRSRPAKAPVAAPVDASANVVAGVPPDADALLVSWQAAETGTDAARYRVQQQLEGGNWATVATTGAETTRYATGVAPSTRRFRVQAVAADGRRSSWARTDWIEVISLAAPRDEDADPFWYSAHQRAAAADAAWRSWHGPVRTFASTRSTFAVVGSRGPDAEPLAVYVDGVFEALVDRFAEQPVEDVVLWVSDWTTAAERTIGLELQSIDQQALDDGAPVVLN